MKAPLPIPTFMDSAELRRIADGCSKDQLLKVLKAAKRWLWTGGPHDRHLKYAQICNAISRAQAGPPALSNYAAGCLRYLTGAHLHLNSYKRYAAKELGLDYLQAFETSYTNFEIQAARHAGLDQMIATTEAL